MEMDKINAIGNLYTWASNREGEGCVEETLAKLFRAASLITRNPRAKSSMSRNNHPIIVS